MNVFSVLDKDVDPVIKKQKTLILRKIDRFFASNPNIHKYSLQYKIVGLSGVKKAMFDIFGVTDDQIYDLIESTGLSNPQWRNRNRTDYLFFMYVVRRCLILKEEAVAEKFFVFYLSYIYGFRQKHWLPHNEGDAITAAMTYTMNSLNKKFTIRTVRGNSPYGVMVYFKDDLLKKKSDFRKNLMSTDDVTLFNCFNTVYNRVHTLVRNIMFVYYDVYEKGLYLNFTKDVDTETGENEARDPKNISLTIDQITGNVLRAFKTARNNDKIIHNLVQRLGVSESNIATVLNSIKSEDSPEQIIRLTLSIFFEVEKDKDVLCSRKFVSVCLKTYSKSFTREESVVALKKLLHDVFMEKLEMYNRTEREATKSDYKKALYLYFVFLIQYTQCA